MNLEEFKKEMDIEKPKWFIDYADDQELKAFARHMTNNNKYSSWTKEDHIYKLRHSVASRLFTCARATHNFIKQTENKTE